MIIVILHPLLITKYIMENHTVMLFPLCKTFQTFVDMLSTTDALILYYEFITSPSIVDWKAREYLIVAHIADGMIRQ